MEELICPKCGVTTDYYTELKSNQNVARCLKCDAFIKNIPQGKEPTFFFGKYNGKKVKDIEDLSYLKWALNNLPKLSKQMREAIDARITEYEFLAK